MVDSTSVFAWQTLTAMINEIKSPAIFLKKLLFSNEITLPTETIELSYLTGDREIAPFVRVNGEAIMVEGYGETFATVKAPNIRIKRPITPAAVLFTRRPGTVIFPTPGEQMSAINAHIARDGQRMADLISNSEEWMAAMAIRGTITYSVDDEEVFTITYPKPAGHELTVGDLWSGTSNPEEDFLAAKRLIADETGLIPTHCVMGQSAATEFMKNARVSTLLDTRNYNAGVVTIESQFREDGALFLGIFAGIPCWEYSRTIDVNGTSTSLIRTDRAEFLCATPAAQNVAYYGAIPDMEAFEGGLLQSKRFAKSWTEKDPSVRQMLVHSRPLFVPRRPGSFVSMKVV